MSPLKRYTIDISRLDTINAQIEAYEKMLDWYHQWKEKNGEYDYIDERISNLNNEMAEYMIAREFAKEGARTYGDEENGV
jgi:hypothetical protein